MNPIAAVGEVAAVAGKAIDLAKIREGRMNTPEMQANAAAQSDAHAADAANAAVASGDIDEIRKQAAE